MTLEAAFTAGAKFPLVAHRHRLTELERFALLFESDRAAMYEWVRAWRLDRADDDDDASLVAPLREFITYPAPKIAARTLAAFLFGEEAKIVSENAADELAAVIEDNQLHALNHEAGVTAAAEGEIYYKVDWNREVSATALLTAISGAYVFPLFRYGRLDEIAFVRRLEHDHKDQRKVCRHVEIRTRGVILNRLFIGSPTALGAELDLEANEETEELEERIETDIDDILARHVPFFRTARSPHGVSIFAGAEGLIEGIHSLYTQDQHDAEMSKRRVAVPSAYLKRTASGRPKFDRNMDVMELDDAAAGAIGGSQTPIQAIEFSDSTVMGQRISQRFDEFLLACGIAPQSAGRDVSGAAESGTARKLAQALTLQTTAVAARYFKPGVRDICRLAIMVGRKHLGAGSSDGEDPIVKVEMSDGIAEDPVEVSTIIGTLSGAAAISTREKVRRLHPDWTEEMVEAEVEQINEDEGLKLPAPMPIGGIGDES